MKCPKCLWDVAEGFKACPVCETPVAKHMELTLAQRNAIISHLANHRGLLRAAAARGNRTDKNNAERDVKEINQLIEVLRGCSN